MRKKSKSHGMLSLVKLNLPKIRHLR